jgi:7-cyano-7-deazaguanine tRNA-ribosyltransferase
MGKSGISFDLKDFDLAGRIGQFRLGDKVMDTPNLFPVVSPFDNAIEPRKMADEFGVQCLFTNAYIINQNTKKNGQILEQGLHKALNFPGIIATDSGGFQDYMYGGDLKISPEEIEPFQEKIGSDCPVILDIPVQTTDSYEVARDKVQITIQRAKENITRRTRTDCAWFGPIHGSIYSDLLEHSTKEMSKLDFGIYAIGGVVKTFIDYRFDLDVRVLLQVKKWLRPNRPLHMFGLGLPNFFSLAVACGADTFDSAAYFLYAKDNRYFTLHGTKILDDLTELPCHCPVCTSYNLDELKKAPKGEKTRLLAEHNLHLSMSELKTIRQAIREGTLWELVEQRVMSHPKLFKAFREMHNFADFIEKLNPTEKARGVKIFNEYSVYRPEIQHYYQKLRDFQYQKSPSQLIFLPDLDLSVQNSVPMQQWLSNLRTRCSDKEYRIIIVSNIFGLIPLELSEIYPVSQHEGAFEVHLQDDALNTLLSISQRLLQQNLSKSTHSFILIPHEFQDEYQEVKSFPNTKHFIYQIENIISKIAPTLVVNKYNDINSIIQDLT